MNKKFDICFASILFGVLTIFMAQLVYAKDHPLTDNRKINNSPCSTNFAKLKKPIKKYFGHRGGCENKLYKDIPDNSLLCLEAGLKGISGNDPLQEEQDFKYLEFDVRETRDGDIVVYHGGAGGIIFHKKKSFRQDHARITYTGLNKEIFDTFNLPIDSKVRNLTKSQITQLYLDGEYCQHIPDILEYFKNIRRLNLTAKLMVEIKHVSCDSENSPAHMLINIVKKYENEVATNPSDNDSFESQKVGFLVYKGKVKNLGGKSNLSCWNKALEGTRLRIYKTGDHDLMKKVMY